MIQLNTIKQRKPRRVGRIRAVIKGTSDRPKLLFFRSNTSLSAQLVDNVSGKTLLGVRVKGKNMTAASELAKEILMITKKLHIKALVFDRGGFKYHGVVKKVADDIRNGGVTI